MATQTPNLNLIKPAGTDYVRIGDFNDNADKLDVSIGDLGQLTTAEKTNLVGAINEANDRGAYPPYIGANKNWYVWSSATAQYVDSGVTAEGADGISAFVWIKWSAIQPTQNSDMKDTPDQFIGVYSGTSPTAPTAYTSYQWYKYKGEKGDVGNPGTGNNWYTGTAITGTSTTPAAYATGIEAAQVGDMYLNNGELPNTGRAYVCTLGGNADTALWKYSCLLRGADGNGVGDMLTSTYDQNSDGIVDDSEKLGGNLSTWYQQATDGLSAEAAIVNEDTFPFYDASASNHRKVTWENIKAVLKTYFDDLYTTALLKLTGYSKAASASAIATTDSINVAFGKLEKGLDDKAVPATDFLATLAAASWVGESAPYTQTVGELTGVTSTSKLDVGLADTATDAQYAEAVAAQIRATGSDTGTVTFKAHGTKPTSNLPILIRMVN